MEQSSTHFTPAYLQYLIKDRLGTTQKALADEFGVSAMAISDLINFNLVSKPLMK